MNKELMFIIHTLAKTNNSKCTLIEYNCSAVGCNNCPFSNNNKSKWEMHGLIPYGILIKEVSEYE